MQTVKEISAIYDRIKSGEIAAFAELEQLAGQHSKNGIYQYYLGLCYYYKHGVNQDVAKASELFKESIIAFYPPAFSIYFYYLLYNNKMDEMKWLAQQIIHRDGKFENDEEIKKTFSGLLTLFDYFKNDSQFVKSIATCYFFGIGTNKSPEHGLEIIFTIDNKKDRHDILQNLLTFVLLHVAEGTFFTNDIQKLLTMLDRIFKEYTHNLIIIKIADRLLIHLFESYSHYDKLQILLLERFHNGKIKLETPMVAELYAKQCRAMYKKIKQNGYAPQELPEMILRLNHVCREAINWHKTVEDAAILAAKNAIAKSPSQKTSDRDLILSSRKMILDKLRNIDTSNPEQEEKEAAIIANNTKLPSAKFLKHIHIMRNELKNYMDAMSEALINLREDCKKEYPLSHLDWGYGWSSHCQEIYNLLSNVHKGMPSRDLMTLYGKAFSILSDRGDEDRQALKERHQARLVGKTPPEHFRHSSLMDMYEKHFVALSEIKVQASPEKKEWQLATQQYLLTSTQGTLYPSVPVKDDALQNNQQPPEKDNTSYLGR